MHHTPQRRKVKAAAICVFLAVSAFAQAVRADTVAAVPDWVLYRFFFLDVTFYDWVAAGLQAKGKDPAPARTKIKIEANLTDQEESQVKAIAQGCRTALANYAQATNAIILAIKAQYPRGTDLPPDVIKQLTELENARQQIVLNHLQQLKTALGSTRFHQLDKYVRATTGRRIRTGSAQTAATAMQVRSDAGR